MKSKLINYDKSTDKISLKIEDLPTVDKLQETIKKMSEEPDISKYDEKLIKEYSKAHKFIKVGIKKTFLIEKGKNFNLGNEKFSNELTFDLLINDKWETLNFSKYNYNTFGKKVPNGALHRLLCVRSQIREIFLEQGFEEMPTNNLVESSFWNFDALFQPQQHPSREAHDTFFLSYPAKANTEKFHPEYFQKVKEIHENGGYGSVGLKYKWTANEEEKIS